MSFNNSPALVLELPAASSGIFKLIFLPILGLVSLTLIFNGLIHKTFFIALLAFELTVIGLGACVWVTGCRPSSAQVKTIVWQQDGTWFLSFSDGQHLHAILSSKSWITSWIWCLSFHTADQKSVSVLLWRGWFTHANWQLWLTRLHLQAVHNANSLRHST